MQYLVDIYLQTFHFFLVSMAVKRLECHDRVKWQAESLENFKIASASRENQFSI